MELNISSIFQGIVALENLHMHHAFSGVLSNETQEMSQFSSLDHVKDSMMF